MPDGGSAARHLTLLTFVSWPLSIPKGRPRDMPGTAQELPLLCLLMVGWIGGGVLTLGLVTGVGLNLFAGSIRWSGTSALRSWASVLAGFRRCSPALKRLAAVR